MAAKVAAKEIGFEEFFSPAPSEALTDRPLDPSIDDWQFSVHSGYKFQYSHSSTDILVAGRHGAWPDINRMVDALYDFAGDVFAGQVVTHFVRPREPWRIHGWSQDSVDYGNPEPFQSVFVASEFQPLRWINQSATIAFSSEETFSWVSPRSASITSLAVVSPPANIRATGDALAELQVLLDAARDDTFEYGETSGFEAEFTKSLRRRTKETLDAFLTLLFEWDRIPKEAAYEALASIGRHWRDSGEIVVVRFLSVVLGHPLPSIRDAAVLALDDVGGKNAVDALSAALLKEGDADIEWSIRQALADLTS